MIKQLKFLSSFWNKAQTIQNKMQLGDLSFECAVCGIAINEIEGFIIENATAQEIIYYLEKITSVHSSLDLFKLSVTLSQSIFLK
jgi:hypothetical protein